MCTFSWLVRANLPLPPLFFNTPASLHYSLETTSLTNTANRRIPKWIPKLHLPSLTLTHSFFRMMTHIIIPPPPTSTSTSTRRRRSFLSIHPPFPSPLRQPLPEPAHETRRRRHRPRTAATSGPACLDVAVKQVCEDQRGDGANDAAGDGAAVGVGVVVAGRPWVVLVSGWESSLVVMILIGLGGREGGFCGKRDDRLTARILSLSSRAWSRWRRRRRSRRCWGRRPVVGPLREEDHRLPGSGAGRVEGWGNWGRRRRRGCC